MHPDSIIQELQQEVIANLSERTWGREGECTYEAGPLTQNVFLCRTCSSSSGHPVAVCFGCSFDCHVDHDIVELWKKRDIRCDCGTQPLEPCRLRQDGTKKMPRNESNVYVPKHNFEGKFCWCDRTYEYEDDVVMLQCSMCTDWFHEKCILDEWKSSSSSSHPLVDSEHQCLIEDVEDALLVCRDCMNPSLVAYATKWDLKHHLKEEEEEELPARVATDVCIAPSSLESPATAMNTTFFVGTFRECLCTCPKCQVLWRGKFLEPDENDDDDDNIEEEQQQEQQDHQRVHGQLRASLDVDGANGEAEQAALAGLSHDGQIRVASGIQMFRELLKNTFEKKYAEGKRVIDVNDVEEFKEELRKKQKK